MNEDFSIKINSLEQLSESVAEFLKHIGNRKIIAFYGKMGAGKTTVIKEICRQLGVKNVVSSPTFALVNEYRDGAEKPVFHFDFYRINKIEEAYDLGYEEYFYSGNLCLIEWPEKIEQLLPDETLIVKIEEVSNNARLLTIMQ